MKYQVTYLKPKRKGYSKQTVIFYTIEDASFYEKEIRQRGCIETEIYPVMSD